MLIAFSFWLAFSQTPDAPPVGEHADVRREIQRLTTRPAPDADAPDSQQTPASSAASIMPAEIKQYIALVDRVDEFLERFPEDRDKARYESLKLRATFLLATLRGRPLDRLRSESARLWADDPSPLRGDIAYWRMRLGPARGAGAGSTATSAPATTPAPKNGDAPTTPEDFATAYPAAPQAVPILKTLIESACDERDFESARRWLRILEDHHPGHVELTRLAGRVRLGETLGQPWRPSLYTQDGIPIDGDAPGKTPTAIVFWSPEHGPSIEMLRTLRDLQASTVAGTLAIVLIAINRDCEQARLALQTLHVDWPASCDGRGWGSPALDEFGIRGLPTVLMVDRHQILRDYIEPGPGGQAARVITRLSALMAPDQAPSTPLGPNSGKP